MSLAGRRYLAALVVGCTLASGVVPTAVLAQAGGEIADKRSDLDDLKKGGELKTPAAKTLRWNVTVEPAPVADLFTIDLSVELDAGKGSARESHERLAVLRPAWSEPVDRAKLFEDLKRRIEDDRRNRGVVAEKRT